MTEGPLDLADNDGVNKSYNADGCFLVGLLLFIGAVLFEAQSAVSSGNMDARWVTGSTIVIGLFASAALLALWRRRSGAGLAGNGGLSRSYYADGCFLTGLVLFMGPVILVCLPAVVNGDPKARLFTYAIMLAGFCVVAALFAMKRKE